MIFKFDVSLSLPWTYFGRILPRAPNFISQILIKEVDTLKSMIVYKNKNETKYDNGIQAVTRLTRTYV